MAMLQRNNYSISGGGNLCTNFFAEHLDPIYTAGTCHILFLSQIWNKGRDTRSCFVTDRLYLPRQDRPTQRYLKRGIKYTPIEKSRPNWFKLQMFAGETFAIPSQPVHTSPPRHISLKPQTSDEMRWPAKFKPHKIRKHQRIHDGRSIRVPSPKCQVPSARYRGLQSGVKIIWRDKKSAFISHENEKRKQYTPFEMMSRWTLFTLPG